MGALFVAFSLSLFIGLTMFDLSHGCSIYRFWKHLCIIKKHPWAGQRGWYGWQKRKHKKCTCNICLFIMCQYISWYMISIYVIHICKLKCKKIYWYICKSICSKNIYKHVDTLGYCFVYKLLRRVNWTIWNLKNCMIMNWNLIDLGNFNFELSQMYHQLQSMERGNSVSSCKTVLVKSSPRLHDFDYSLGANNHHQQEWTNIFWFRIPKITISFPIIQPNSSLNFLWVETCNNLRTTTRKSAFCKAGGILTTIQPGVNQRQLPLF